MWGESVNVRVVLEPETQLKTRDVVVVVDVLRATTTATALFERGLRTLVLAEYLASAQRLRRDGEYLVGEDGGATPAAFDIGNSPADILTRDFSDQRAVLTTSNGTRAAHRAAEHSSKVVLACLNNAAAACEVARQWAEREITILCAGQGGKASPDDTYVAGHLASRLLGKGATPLGDTNDAVRFYRDQPDAEALFARVGHYLEPLGLTADIAVCAQQNVSQAVAILHGKRGEGLVFRDARSR